MGTGAMIMTWLAMAVTLQAPAADVSYMNERDFQIPITLPADPAFQAEIEQLFLFVSADEGKTWRQEAVASPRDKSFPFHATRDGSYWFNVSILDKDKKSYPPDIAAVPPALKVIVDTRKPIVKLPMVERVGDVVNVTWAVQDENPDLASLQLEYGTSESPNWYLVPVTPPTATGQKRWQVTTSGKIMVRVQIQDAAGNMGMAQAEAVYDSGALTLASNPPTAAQVPPPSSVRPSPAPPVDSPFPTHAWQKPSIETPPPPATPVALSQADTAPTRPEPGPVRPEAAPARPVDSPSASKPVSNSSGATPTEDSTQRVIARGNGVPPPSWTSVPKESPAAVPGNPPAPVRPKSPGPAVNYTNLVHLDLNYEAKAGPSGLGEVQLWITQDDGRTWRRFADDVDLQPPFAIDLPGEGTYGFALIIRSKGGIYKGNRAAPQPGEAPELRIEVDTTPPEAVLYSVEADPRRKDALFLLWNATDRNMAAKPISFKWSERAGGPWQEIASDLTNTGRFEWQMPSNLPYRVFLRMEVRDQAGNLSIAETPEPVLVDLTEPEGTLIGVMSGLKK